MDSVTQLLILYVSTGSLLMLLCVPLILRKIPQNRLYGFRVAKTLSDPQIWYEANSEAGKYFAAAGFFIVLGAVTFYFYRRWDTVYYASALLLLATFSLSYALVRSFLYLRHLDAQPKG